MRTRLHPRSLVVGTVLLLTALGVAMVNLSIGDFPVPLAEVLRSLAGQGTAGTDFIVYDLRLPRVLTTLLVGAALGASGSVFQSLTRNPLGSPDLVGLTVGAASGALLVMLVLGLSGFAVAAGAIVGCLVTSVAIYLLAFRRGSTQPFRLVLMGIGVSALLEAANSYLIYRSRLDEALAAQVWLIGSVNGRGWTEVTLVAGTLILLLPVVLYFGRHLTMLTLGDEIAVLHGVRVESTRAVLALAGVGLAAGATAAAGPIAFVALAAPPLAARLARSPRAGALPAAMMGAALLTVSDWAAQHAVPGADLPVGVVTAALGGAYLSWLLFRESRTRSRS